MSKENKQYIQHHVVGNTARMMVVQTD